ncbi:hypothetical protein SBV1_370117 [Verrucomicrobia bacterium]|nr:hypothetical protein SBV1_370117 [Verrucomicrobiota bacterium]
MLAERDQIRAQLEELRGSRPRLRAYVRQGNGQPQALEVRPQPASARPGGGEPFEITDEDGRLSRELTARQRKGEYIARFDDPVAYKRQKQAIAKGVQMLAASNRKNLAPVFARVGLSDQVSEQLQAHVSKINDAAMQAEAALMQLETARVDYDSRVQSLLSPADYVLYKQYEAAGPARQQFERLERFAWQEGRTMVGGERGSLVAIIREAEAYPKESYLGPYDGLPVVAVGKENVLRNAKHQLAEVDEGANRAVRLAAERGLSKRSIGLLRDYYARDIQKRSDEIQWIQDPKTEEGLRAGALKRAREGEEKLRGTFPAKSE